MPDITSITQSLSDPWDEINFLDTMNDNCEGLELNYIWEVVSGHPILSLMSIIVEYILSSWNLLLEIILYVQWKL